MKKLILLTLSIVSFNNYAVDFVYRVDSTPPDVIFRDGFSLLGYNRNFQQFISGRSCSGGSSDSRYIATTSSVNQTYAIARRTILAQHSKVIYTDIRFVQIIISTACSHPSPIWKRKVVTLMLMKKR